MFRIKVSEQSIEKFKNMDINLSSMLMSWIRKNLSKSANPRSFGKALFKKDNRFWQYRLGDIRLLAIIYDDNRLIVLTDINYNDSL